MREGDSCTFEDKNLQMYRVWIHLYRSIKTTNYLLVPSNDTKRTFASCVENLRIWDKQSVTYILLIHAHTHTHTNVYNVCIYCIHTQITHAYITARYTQLPTSTNTSKCVNIFYVETQKWHEFASMNLSFSMRNGKILDLTLIQRER